MQPEEIRMIVTVGDLPLFNATVAELRTLRRFASYMNDAVLGEIGEHLVAMFGKRPDGPAA